MYVTQRARVVGMAIPLVFEDMGGSQRHVWASGNKMLVASIGCERFLHCREQWIHYLGNFNDVEFLFVTATDDVQLLSDAAKSLGDKVTVLPGKDRVANLNMVRERFLKSDHDRLLLLDGSVMGPTNIIEALDRHKKDVTFGTTLRPFEVKGKAVVLPALWVPDKPGTSRQLGIVDLSKPRLLPVSIGSLSCVLVRKAVLEQVEFAETEKGSASTAFCLAARDAGFQLYADTLVQCLNVLYPLDDTRNKLLDPRRYKLKVRAKLKEDAGNNNVSS